MEKRFGFVATLKHSDFRTLWLGQLISQVGDSFTIIAVLVVINELTGSTLALGAMVMAVTLPQLLFGLIAGVLVDRLDRKVTMIVSDIVRGLAVLALLAIHRADQIPILLLVGFVIALMGSSTIRPGTRSSPTSSGRICSSQPMPSPRPAKSSPPSSVPPWPA